MSANYDPANYQPLTFHDRTADFRAGNDTPRQYLERCIAEIDAHEPRVQAFVRLNVEAALSAADASTRRWQSANPLSPIDGMPVGIKDLLDTKDMPTEMGCEAYRGRFPKQDSPAVWALREAGAVILGKTVTAELGGFQPGPTTNPFDVTRTPGGSSSGSAAAVAARFVPAAIGTQVGGSVIRPAAFCGNVALKPSQGGINRGDRQPTSMSTHGVHAGCTEDMWQVAIEIASRAGGDRGFPGIVGPGSTPESVRPHRLIALQSQGWKRVEEGVREAYQGVLDQLAAAGVELVTRQDSPLVETLEQCLRNARQVASMITLWENWWWQRDLVAAHPDGVSARTQGGVELAERMTPEDYRGLLRQRELAHGAHRAVAGEADGVVMLSCPGPAPVWEGDPPDGPPVQNPTGDMVFNTPSSLLFAPAVTMPLLAVGGLPVGVQFMGQQGEDARMTGFARWALASISPVCVE